MVMRMDINIYFTNEIKRFQRLINTYYKFSEEDLLKYKIKVGYNRCLSRLRDYKTRDVNKRCKNMTLGNSELCKKCQNICKYGKVTEPIDENSALYKTYKKKNSSFMIDYNHNVKIFCEYREEDYLEVMRKNEKRISKNNSINQMNSIIEIDTIYNDLDRYVNIDEIKNINLEDVLTLHNLVNRQKNEIVKKMKLRLSIAETEEFYDKIMSYIKDLNKKEKTISIEDGERITLKEFNNQADVIMIKNEEEKDNWYNLYYETKSGYVLVGYGRNWIDTNGDVPNEHKNYENIVLDEDTRVPVLEIEITKDGHFIMGIPEGIYREWEYDEDMEQFRRTEYIERY
jgi:hypothetical protein